MTRPLYAIAEDIERDYRAKGKPVHYSAAPYVDAMRYLETLGDWFGMDSADMVVRYALSNLSTWRGDKAREVKAELRAMLAEFDKKD